MQEGVLTACFLALLIGIVAGLRTMTALAAASWAAHLGRVDLSNTWLAFLGYSWTPWILSVFALVEFVTDQLPSTPSRTVPVQFGARIVCGALAGGSIGASRGVFVGWRDRRHCRRDHRNTRRARGARAAGRGIRERQSRRLPRGCCGGGGCAAHRVCTAMSRYDAIIIGVGQAGSPLAGRLTQAGMTVAIVERKLFGGTCVNTGCMPTKTLVASAYAAHLARRSADYGIVSDGAIRVDMPRVKARADSVSGNARRGIEKWLARHDRLPCARGARPLRGAGRRSCRR